MTLFGVPRWEKYADIVTFRSIEEAERAAEVLREEFMSAKTHAKKLRVWHVADLAAKRAAAASKKKNLKPETRRRLIKVAKIYHKLADELHALLYAGS